MRAGGERLGDFTATGRVLVLAAMAAVVGVIAAFVAVGLRSA